MSAALTAAGVTQEQRLGQVDEMRFGLWGQVRRRWGLRGVQLVQRVQITFAWRYWVLAVNCLRGELKWAWVDRVRQHELLPVLKHWSPEAVVWDSAAPHKGRQIARLGIPLIFLPPYAPELDPAERVFEEIRREIEGVVYPSLQAKQAAIEHFLRRLAADRQRLIALIGWDWIQAAHATLPSSDSWSL